MATIYLDGTPYEVEDGQNLLQACLSLGFNIPYFCWHPALHSVGACRQCAVKRFKNEEDQKGEIVMACMTPAVDNTRISINDTEARQFRASIIEWLMTNHPHDCPVCDEGGECHLQDMTVMSGHGFRQFRFAKRTFRNQYLGPFINHEMNRCIQCYRCLRFYHNYAGGRDFNVFGCHHHVYFGRHREGVLENEFSGNLVEICPTGVFTDKTVKQHYTRKWDLQTAPSVCVHCSLGCNIIAGERYGRLRRIRNRYNHEVNGYFLCDRGRYGYEFVNSDRRLRQPMVKAKGTFKPVSKERALEHLATLLNAGNSPVGIGSPRASLEANFALRALVGPERFYLGFSDLDFQLVRAALKILQQGPARSPSLREIGSADAVLVLGEDLTNTAPLMALALHQLVYGNAARAAAELQIPVWNDAAIREIAQDQKAPLVIAAPTATKLDHVAKTTYRASPDEVARLGFAVARCLSHEPVVVEGMAEEEVSLAQEIAQLLRQAKRPVVISGTGCGSEAVIQAAANVAWSLAASNPAAGLSLVVPECNSLGLALLGGQSLEAACQVVQAGGVDSMIVLENDLYRRSKSAAVDDLLSKIEYLVVIDHLASGTTAKAQVVLPAATFAEAAGTLVSNEGRAQRFFQVFVPEGEVQASWRWLRDISRTAGSGDREPWENLDQLVSALAEALPVFQGIQKAAPPAAFRLMGEKIARQSHRFTGRTAMLANITVHEPKPEDDPDSPLAFSMEGYQGLVPPSLITRFWASGWNSVQAVNKFQSEVGGPLRGGDPGSRLIEPEKTEKFSSFDGILPTMKIGSDEWLIVPVHHIFGSEELSTVSAAIAERSPKPYVALNPEDAASLELDEGEKVELALDDGVFQFPSRFVSGLPHKVAGLPVGLPGATTFKLPAVGKVKGAADRAEG
ncbi:MAG: NADH-quinone oxidoreductase subunit NuoG [Deltaproteobacteria bacterium]|nr:NADH-quinone oxidoreductase subunit NuoG [Deltaproteobacteria bacterium]